MLLTGKTPEGWDFKKMMKIGSKITSDPSGVLRDLVEEKLEAAAEGEEEPAEPAVRLYAPGRLVFLQVGRSVGWAGSWSAGLAGQAGGQG